MKSIATLLLVAAALFMAACAGAPTPEPPQATVPSPPPTMLPTPTATVAMPTPLPPTVVPGATATQPPAPPTASPDPTATHEGVPVPATQPAPGDTPIRVTIGGTVLAARLRDNSTARDLIAQLPLTLTFRDFNNVEKIAQLPQRLSMEGVPAGDDPFPQDIGYYAPSGDLVFYYDDVGFFTGIVRLGQFDGSMDAIISQSGPFTATIELAD